MVAGSADNGGCQPSVAVYRDAAPAVCVTAAAGAGHSRKTARGASSPAKPALHIPELGTVSSSPSHQHAALAAVEGGGAARQGRGRSQCDTPQQGWR